MIGGGRKTVAVCMGEVAEWSRTRKREDRGIWREQSVYWKRGETIGGHRVEVLGRVGPR
jgi:hypothetical protein